MHSSTVARLVDVPATGRRLKAIFPSGHANSLLKAGEDAMAMALALALAAAGLVHLAWKGLWMLQSPMIVQLYWIGSSVYLEHFRFEIGHRFGWKAVAEVDAAYCEPFVVVISLLCYLVVLQLVLWKQRASDARRSSMTEDKVRAVMFQRLV